jgi:hypothetical protein
MANQTKPINYGMNEEQYSNLKKASVLLWQVEGILQMIANTNPQEVSGFDTQNAINGAINIMNQGLDHLGEV